MDYLEVSQQGKNGFLRYLSLFFIWLLVLALGSFFALIAIHKITGKPIQLDKLDFAALGLNPALGLFLLTAPFLFGLLVHLSLFRWMHQRPIITLFNGFEKIRKKRIFQAIAIYLGLALTAELVIFTLNPENYTFQLNGMHFVQLVFVSFLMFPFQAAMEEVIFRGYLMQGFANLFRYKIAVLFFSALLFGAFHLGNPEVEEMGYALAMLYYSSFGLFLGIIVVMDKGLEVAIGVHAINNIYLSILITFPNSTLPTPALFSLKELDVTATLIGWVITAIAFLIIGARVFGWKNWSSLFQKIEPLPQSAFDLFEDDKV